MSASVSTPGVLAAIRRASGAAAAAAAAMVLCACSWMGTQAGDGARVLGRGERELVVLPGPHDTMASLASRYLGDPKRGWEIADVNGISAIVPGRDVLIPLRPVNPTGVYENGYQLVPILSYHRFDRSGHRLAVRPEMFRKHLEYLRDNDFRVVPLSHVGEFLRGERALPRRAVVITVDDGFRSTYQVAYPLLLEFGFPATVFVYTDFANRGGMSFAQLREMEASGLIDIQSHSKSHASLTASLPGESRAAYRKRVIREMDEPKARLARELNVPVTQYAYPYGDTNAFVMEQLQASGYEMGLTVMRGANAFFAHPLALRRSMVFSDHGVRGFVVALKTFEAVPLR